MFIKKHVLLVGLCALVAGCATTNSPISSNGYFTNTENATDMGVRYLLGRGVPKNEATAFSYFRTGAEQDDPFAQNELAYMYAAGKGTPRDYQKAVEYYQKAADHGLASAQYNLGLMYLHGLGTAQNRTIAMKWIQKSADHGFEPAKQALITQSAAQ